jgi:predicted Zn-dependent protease
VRRRAGKISDADFRAAREAGAKDMKQRMPPGDGSAWFWFYGDATFSPADAREALDALPQFSPLPAYDGQVYQERVMGQVLLLAGRVDEAIPHLRRAVSACFSPDTVRSHQRAAELLGEALEAKSDKPGACAAYGEVLAHWGSAKPRSVTADAARAHVKKLGCSP